MRALLAPGQKSKTGAKSGSRDRPRAKSKVVIRRKVVNAPTPPSGSISTAPISHLSTMPKQESSYTVSKASSPSVSNEKVKKGVVRSKSRERTRANRTRTEKTETTESDESKGKKVYVAPKKSQPKKVTVAHHTVDQDEMRKFLKKAKDKKTAPRAEPRHLSQREALLMDVVKKPSAPRQYKYRGNKDALPMAEDASFFDKPEPKTVTVTVSEDTLSQEDSYEHAPKLSDIAEMPTQNVFEPDGVTPFWATVLEPNEEELKDVAEPISVGSDHVEMMMEGKINLKTAKGKNVFLDEFQSLSQLMKRDNAHFHTHLVFSNTIRSLINVGVKMVGPKPTIGSGDVEEQMTQREETVTFDDAKPVVYLYDRSDPIGSSRAKVAEGVTIVGSADSADSIEGK